jgi:hypothetical protein
MSKLVSLFAGAAAIALIPAAAFAQAAPQADQQPAAAAPAPGDSPICTDRPTKANSTCTVPAGHWQLETDFVNWTHASEGGVTTDVTLAPNPTLKYGLSDKLDIEANWAPWEEVRVKAGGASATASGVGDLFIRLKIAAVSNSQMSLSVIPFVKAPTASHNIGNGEVEGGLAIPISVNLPDKFSLTFGPEFDSLANAALDGHHLNMVQLINLSRPVTDKLTLYGELWWDRNQDPLGTVTQSSADVAAAYAINNTLQVDIGGNFGLNRDTPHSQLYVGISKRW